MIWNLIGTIGGKVLDIVDDVVEDKDEANRLKFEIQRQLKCYFPLPMICRMNSTLYLLFLFAGSASISADWDKSLGPLKATIIIAVIAAAPRAN